MNLADLKEAARRTDFWLGLGYSDTVARYRRSILGPLWLTLGIAISVLGLGFFWSTLWRVSLQDYFPYLTAGIIVWNYIVTNVVESCQAFLQQKATFRSVALSPFLVALRMATKNIFVFAHNFIVFFIVAWYFSVPVGLVSFLSLIGIIVLFLNSVLLAVTFGMAGARFRDLGPIVESFMPLLFFLTPVLWRTKDLGERAYIAELNPLTHFLALVREPLLGNVPPMHSYLIVFGCTLALGLIASVLYRRYRQFVVLWVS